MTPNLDELGSLNARLASLLADPQPGLITWNEALVATLRAIATFVEQERPTRHELATAILTWYDNSYGAVGKNDLVALAELVIPPVYKDTHHAWDVDKGEWFEHPEHDWSEWHTTEEGGSFDPPVDIRECKICHIRECA